MTPDSSFKFFGLLSIVLVWMGLLFLLYRWKGNKSLSFSVHAAQTKGGQIYYFILFAIVLPPFYLFMLRWFVPALELPDIFSYLVTLGILGQVLAVVVPAIPGRKERIHNLGAYTMAFTMIPLCIMLGFTEIDWFARLVALLTATYMIGAGVLFLTVKRSHDYYLYFQAPYIALFHITILISTYSL